MSNNRLIDITQSAPFKVALKRCQQRFSSRDDKLPTAPRVTMQDVTNAIRDIERDEEKRGEDTQTKKVYHRLQSLLEFIERYSKAINTLVQGSGDIASPVSLVWGMLCIVVEAASSAMKYKTSILNLLEDLGGKVSVYSVYAEEAAFDQPRFQNALATVYIDIISILVKAGQKLKKNRGIRKLLRFWTINFESDFGEEMNSVQRHIELLKDETTLSHRLHMHRMAKASLEDKINQWLCPLDCWGRIADLIAIRQPDSGEWLLKNETYVQWKESTSQSSLLWLWGDPGMGKTILSSKIVQDLQTKTGCITTYFHCDADTQPSRTTLGLLTSIISQLKVSYQSQSPTSALPQCLVEAFETSVKFGRPSVSSADSPEQLLLALASSFDQPIVLVIDGLDEMLEPEKTSGTLLKLSSQSKSLRVFFLSRNIPVLKKKLQELPQIWLSPKDLQNDIRSYVVSRAGDIPFDEDDIPQQVVDQICEKAEGMFLWAKMVLDDLVSATSPTHIKTILHQCPPGLHAMYRHFLQGLAAQTPEKQQITRDIMRWVVCAARPLTVTELEGALVAGLQDQAEKPFKSTIVEACSPFITVTGTEETVRAVHESVREYLIEKPDPAQHEEDISLFFISPKEVHPELAMRCIHYVNNTIQLARSEVFSLETTMTQSFHSYALAYWCHHTISGQYRADLEDQIGLFLKTPEQRQSWLYHMIFAGSGDPFPFQMILRLQARLAEWTEKREGGEEDSDIKQGLRVSEKEWSMDALELLLKLQSHPGKGAQEANGAARATRTNIDISYFITMMVMRDLARRLTQGGFLVQAILRLEELRSSPHSRPQPTPSVSFVLNILGILYDQQGRIEESRAAHLEALSMQKIAAGGSDILRTKDPECIWSTNELGRVHRHLGNLSEAIGMHRSVLEVLKETLASDHPERLWTMATMARALREQGQGQEALELHVEAYNARCKSPGELHPHTLWSAGDVAKCYRDMGNYDEALRWFRRALEGRLDTLGPEHPDTLWSKNHMGLILEDLGRQSEAISIHKEALQGQEKVLGKEHAHTRWTQTVVSRLQSGG